jgi:hypothetical protein
MFCRPVIFYVLNCITYNIHVNEGPKYFPLGLLGLLLPALDHSNFLNAVVKKQFSPQNVSFIVVDDFRLFCV